MIVHPDKNFEYTIGGGTFEAEVLEDALAAMRNRLPVTREYRLTKADLGMYCQGLVKVLFESYMPRPQLLIFGGGHVGQALCRLVSAAEIFSVIVIDDRKEYATRRKHPRADRVVYTDRSFCNKIPSIDEDTYVVIVTRCHATDKLLVKRYLNAPAAYLGLIGSDAKIKQFRRELMEEGIQSSALDILHAPIGLPIGGKDPAEVAVSILAELIQVKNSRMESDRTVAFQIKDRHL